MTFGLDIAVLKTGDDDDLKIASDVVFLLMLGRSAHEHASRR